MPVKKKYIWKILFIVGLCPFIYPILLGIYTMSVGISWSWFDWLVMYSFIYWPTYLLGIILIVFAIIYRKR